MYTQCSRLVHPIHTLSLNLGDVDDHHVYPDPKSYPPAVPSQYAMNGEFGGVGAFIKGKEWKPDACFAYRLEDTPTDLANNFIQMATSIKQYLGNLSAAILTQITDVETECDGFFNYDRTNKFTQEDTNRIYEANRAIINTVL